MRIENRLLSFVIIFCIYVLATLVGITVYNLLPYDLWLNLLIADVVATVFTFIFSNVFKNASVYDPYWSVQPLVILFAFAIKGGFNTAGLLMIIAVTVWGVRLTGNWAYTFHGLTHQDWRYTMLNEKTGKFYPVINFVGIHLVPTLVVYGCVLPAVYTITNKPDYNFGSIIFFAVCVFAVLLQGIADVQMHKYRKNRTTTFIHNGLWKYSRHPNYLGEILMWWGIALSSFCTIHKWYLLLGAFANTLLFTFVSIPMADARQSQKQGFSEYKQSTHALVPLPLGISH